MQKFQTSYAECDLSQASFDGCDLAGATFDMTNLEKANLQETFNYIINPQTNKIKKAKFSLAGIQRLLTHYDIEIIS